MENSTYKLNVFCKNCKFKGEHTIKTGIKIENAECPNGGCQTLIKNPEHIKMTLKQENYS